MVTVFQMNATPQVSSELNDTICGEVDVSMDHGRTNLFTQLACASLTPVIFLCDFLMPLGVTMSVAYVGVILFSLQSPRQRFTVIYTVICVILTLVWLFDPPPGVEFWKILENRILVAFVIGLTAIMGLLHRSRYREILAQRLRIAEQEQQAQLHQEQLRTLEATMNTVQDIVGNFLNNLQILRMEAEDGGVQEESLAMLEELSQETAEKLQKIASMESVTFEDFGPGVEGLDYENQDK